MVQTHHLTFMFVKDAGLCTFLTVALARKETSHSLRSEIRNNNNNNNNIY